MPATRTQKKKDLLTYASVTLSSGKSVGSANKKSELPTLKNQKQLNLLALALAVYCYDDISHMFQPKCNKV